MADELINTSTVPTNLVDTSAPLPSVDPVIAESRARSYHMALGTENSPGVDALRHRLLQPGGDESLRREHATRRIAELQNRRHDLVRNYVSNVPEGQRTTEDVQNILALARGEVDQIESGDPNTLFEKLRAKRLTGVLENTPQQRAASTQDSALMRDITQGSERTSANQAYAARRLEELMEQYRGQGWVESIGQHITQAIPFMSWYRLQNAVEDAPRGNVLPGSNVRGQIEHYYSLPPDEAARQLDRAITELTSGGAVAPGVHHTGNLLDAIALVRAIESPDSATIGMFNIMAFADIASVWPWRTVGRLARGEQLTRPGEILYRAPRGTPTPTPNVPPTTSPSAQAPQSPDVSSRAAFARQEPGPVSQAATAQAQVIDAAARHPNEAAPLAEAAGDLMGAARTNVLDEVENLAQRAGQIDSFASLRGYTRSIFDIENLTRGSGLNKANELTLRLQENRDIMLRATMIDPVNVQRIPEGSLAERISADEAERMLMHTYPNAIDGMADIRISNFIGGQSATENLTQRINALPSQLRGVAREAHDTLADIQAAQKSKLYSDFRRGQIELQQLIGQLNRIAGTNVKTAGGLNKLKTAMASVNIDEYKQIGKEINDAVRALTPENRALFQKAWKAEQKYKTARERINVTTDFPRPVHPTGLDALNSMTKPRRFVTGLGNVRYLEADFVRRTGAFFENYDEAILHAERIYGFKNYQINQQGTGWYVTVQQPLAETSSAVRDAMIVDTNLNRTFQTPAGAINTYITRKLLSNDYVLPKELVEALKLGTYGGSNLINVMTRLVKENIGPALRTAKERKEFLEFIEHQRVTKFGTTREASRFSPSQFEFEKEWLARNGEMPTLAQSTAYWTYAQVSDIDYVVLNLGIYRDKVRMGWQNFELKATGVTPEQTPRLEGRLLTAMPPRSERFNAGIIVHDADTNKMAGFWYGKSGNPISTKKADEAINFLVGRGYKIIQVPHLMEEQLRKLPGFEVGADRPINFILTREYSTAPLQYRQLPYNPGIRDYDFPVYLKQPKIRGTTYYGDTTVHGFEFTGGRGVKALPEYQGTNTAEHWAKSYETARRALQAVQRGVPNAERALERFLQKNMPYTLKEWKKRFEDGTFDINQPFLVVRNGERTSKRPDMSGRFEQNAEDNPFNMYNGVSLRYAMERNDGLLNPVRAGTHGQPIWHLKRAPVLDALPSLTRATTHLMRNRHIADLQHKAAEGFVTEFAPVLRGTREELRADPWWTLFNAQLVEDTTDRALLSAAMNYRERAKKFFDLSTPEEQTWLTVQQRLNDMLQQSSLRKSPLKSPWLLGTIRDPFQMAKNFTHYYVLASLQQYIQQAAGIAMVIGAEGYRGGMRGYRALGQAATSGMLLARKSPVPEVPEGIRAIPAALIASAYHASNRSKEMLNGLGDMIVNMGWTKQEFMEAHDALLRSGFHNVGREYATQGNFSATGPVQTTLRGKMFDATRQFGMSPFKHGEAFPRRAAWFASYDKWKFEHPGRMPTDRDLASILNYADVLNGRMSAASMTPWQSGFLGWTTAFWSYNSRIFGTMLDTRPGGLTATQRASVVFHNWMLFGAGGAAGTLTFGLPTIKWLQSWLLDLQESDTIPAVTDTNSMRDRFIQTAIHGFVSQGIREATGTRFNVGEQFGLGSSKIFTDLIQDSTTFEFMLGATDNVVRNNINALSPFLHWALDAFRSTPIGYNPFNARDLKRLLTAQPGIGDIHKAIIAYNLGQYTDNMGLATDEITKFQSIVFGLTGMVPQDISNMYAIISNTKAVREVQNRMQRQAQYWWNESITAATENDDERAVFALDQVKASIAMGGFRNDQKNVLWRRLHTGNEETLFRIYRNYAQRSQSAMDFYNDWRRRRQGTSE